MNTPYEADEEERENLFREAALRALPLLQSGVAHVVSAKSVKIGYAQYLFAIGAESRSMRDVAASLNVTVACISKGAKEFVRENNLPIPACMKSEESAGAYREAREEQLN